MKIILSGYGKMGKDLEKELSKHQLYIVSPETKQNFEDVKEEVNLIIDFSIHTNIFEIKKYLQKNKSTKVIFGTTGYTFEELSIIEEIAKQHVVIKSSNYSKGVNILFALINKLSEFDLNKEDIYLLEKHHKYKLDTPSGTSKTIIESLNKPIQIECIKNGEIIGEHQLDIYLDNEMLTVSHRAFSRNIFSKGVMEVIHVIEDLKPGLYTLEDLNLWKEKR